MEVVPADAYCLLRTRSGLHSLSLNLGLLGLRTTQKPLRTAIGQACLPLLVSFGVDWQRSFSELVVGTCFVKLQI